MWQDLATPRSINSLPSSCSPLVSILFLRVGKPWVLSYSIWQLPNNMCTIERIEDIVKATVTSGKKVGTYTGRVAVRATGSFNITTAHGTVQGISYKYCKAIHKMDGYSYQVG